MKITHIALWTSDLECQVEFWKKYFSGIPNEKYISKNNPGFESYFIKLQEGPTIELMTKPDLVKVKETNNMTGWVHIAISVGSEQAVNNIATQAEKDGILVGKPRLTGDGYYEAVIEDPDGNLVEIVS
ncbi:VOC family protein [Zophobihabitans entericus]|uniref:Glyoxalase/bleomycin resistance/extradiol dioxygenase family protein n=1 Tax=Zophobihabitans entericus TaxID=1635327 RepID=A0A6G9IAC8_9GAMM|nr:VOC family protein [Zophobihabitans entericus]QIQ21188.1 glyoxalase/bleomycin resistance/extradiol dioxygenase family protein [Zophobihabitans entericus]